MNAKDRLHEEDLQRLRGFRLLDDDFMTKCFEGSTDCIELVLRIVLDKPDLKALEVRTQVFVENLLNRSVRLDIVATDSAGTKYNVEIQRADKGAGRRRARYNASAMDMGILPKGEDCEDLPEVYVIFITENDVLRRGEAVTRVERYFSGTQEEFGDGSHILYVNGSYRGPTPIGKLIHDFGCTDPADMNYDVLAERVKFFKESKEGVATMCKVMEDMRTQAIREGMKDVAIRMLKAGRYAIDEIVAISGLSVEEIERLNISTKVQ